MSLEKTFINDFVETCLQDGRQTLQDITCSLGYLPFSDCSIEKIKGIAKTLYDYVAPVLQDNYKECELKTAGGDLYIAMLYDDHGTIFRVWNKLTEKPSPTEVFNFDLIWFVGEGLENPDIDHWYVDVNYFTESK